MGTYENPAMISGANTGSTSSNIGSKAATKKKDSENTSDSNASTDIKKTEMEKTTEALNNTEPGNGPINQAMSGDGNVSGNFSLIDQSGNVDWKGAAGIKGSDDNKILGPSTLENQAATKNAMNKNKNTNVSDGGSGSSSYDDAHKKWKEAGMHRTTLSNEGYAVYHTKGTNKPFDQDQTNYSDVPKENQGGVHATSKYIEDRGGFKETRAEYTQGTDAKIFKSESGAIIENIPGEYGKTRDRAIIYKPTTSTQKLNPKREMDIIDAKPISTKKLPTTLKTPPVDPTAGMNRRQVNKAWRQQNTMGVDGKPLAETGVTTEIRNQAIKRIKQENKAARHVKMQKKLENNPFKQYKKEYRAMDNKPAGIAGHGKVKNARQYAKAKMKQNK